MYIKVNAENIILTMVDDNHIKEEEKANFKFIEGAIPNLHQEGKMLKKLAYNPETNGIVTEYEDAPPTEMEKLQAENAELKNSVADLWEVILLGGEAQ